MSSRATATSSFTQMYCCFNRDPQVLCRRLNEMARLASVAEKSFTGIETIPNETVSEAIAYQIEVGRFFGAERFVPVTNAHMMGDIEVMGDSGLAFLADRCAK